ncbi:MAG: helix-turn-helix domain-containing protein [Bacilli bacterium]
MNIKLKEMRYENKYTTKDMALKLGISRPFYSQIENERRNLSYKMALNIAAVFKMKPDDIFYDEFKEKM